MATGDGQVFQIPNKTKAVSVLDKTAFVGKISNRLHIRAEQFAN
jgi:hypothetical protein